MSTSASTTWRSTAQCPASPEANPSASASPSWSPVEDLLHVLDEPSIGLHRRDVLRLFKALAELPGPVLMVEHDAAAVASADEVLEIGPGAGSNGGRLVFQGAPAKLLGRHGVGAVLLWPRAGHLPAPAARA